MNELFLDNKLAALWKGEDAFEKVDQLRGKVFRQVARRRTLRVKIGGDTYFLKRHHGVGWLEILKNLVSLRWPVLGAGNEFRAVQALLAAGVCVPEPVAYAEQGGSPAARESFLLSCAIEPSISLEDLAKEWRLKPPLAADRWRLVEKVAELTRTMHEAGVNHRDLYICHFLLDPDNFPADSKLTLIDLHRAQLRADVPRRWLVKDLGALWFSAADAQPTKRDAYRFIKHYTGRGLRAELGDGGTRSKFWNAVGARAARLHAEAVRKGLANFADPFAHSSARTSVNNRVNVGAAPSTERPDD